MKLFKLFATLTAVALLSSCASQMTQDEREYCIWRSSLAGTAIGAIGGVGGAAAGAAGGAALGAVACGPVAEPVAEVAMAEPLDSDGDGVPDSRDRCAGTEAGVKVDEWGCALDSDGDGVPDHVDACPGTSKGVAVDAKGCPLPGETLLILEDVNFAHDSTKLDSSSSTILDGAVKVLRQNAGVKVIVEGHTDNQGTEEYNQGLSERRAQSVRDYLVNAGIAASRLTTAGRGENSPVASNDTKDGRRKNRRVELTVSK